jgi:hypothetical protein
LKAIIAEQDKKIANLFELVTNEKPKAKTVAKPSVDWKKIKA